MPFYSRYCPKACGDGGIDVSSRVECTRLNDRIEKAKNRVTSEQLEEKSMCYFLYGSLYGDVSESEYVDVKNKYGLKISLGTKHDIKSAVRAAAEFVQDDFRITDWICDCDSPVGKHDPTDPTIIELSNLITELSDLPGAKQINICKTWTGKQNKKEIKINLDETNLPTFLADLQENILYCLNI